MKISIYIPVFNQRDELQRTLRALIPEKGGHEVFVVDRGGSDGSMDVLKGHDWAAPVDAKEHQLAAALNRAVSERGDGELLFFLRPGAVPARGWSQALADSLGKEVDAGHLHCRETDAPSAWAAAVRGLAMKIGHQILGGPASLNGVAVKRETFDKVEGFREVPDFEWLAFANRLRQAGALVKPIRHEVLTTPVPGSRHVDAWQELKEDLLAAWNYRKTNSFDPKRCRRNTSAAILFGYDVFPSGDVNDYYNYAREKLTTLSLEMMQSYRGVDRMYFIGGTKSARLAGQPSGVEVVGKPGDPPEERLKGLLAELKKRDTEALLMVRGLSGDLTHRQLRTLCEGEAEAPCNILPEKDSGEWLALWLEKPALDALEGWKLSEGIAPLRDHLRASVVRSELEAPVRALRTDSDARAMYYAGVLDRLPA